METTEEVSANLQQHVETYGFQNERGLSQFLTTRNVCVTLPPAPAKL